MTASQVVSVAAASLAAVLSAVNLWVTSRREERKWRRESTVETIVQFMDGSFRLPGNKAYKALADGADPESLRASADEGFQACVTALTRLRILAPNELVASAEHLHDLDDRITERLLSARQLPTLDEWSPLADARMDARTEVLNAARRGLGLGAARDFRPTRHRMSLMSSGDPTRSSGD